MFSLAQLQEAILVAVGWGDIILEEGLSVPWESMRHPLVSKNFSWLLSQGISLPSHRAFHFKAVLSPIPTGLPGKILDVQLNVDFRLRWMIFGGMFHAIFGTHLHYKIIFFVVYLKFKFNLALYIFIC